MDKIKFLNISSLRNNEHFEFITRIVTLTTSAGAAALNIEPQLAALKAAVAKEDLLLVRVSQSILTKRINEADAARDELYMRLLQTVRTNEVHINEAVRISAERVMQLMKTYGEGKVARMPIDEESSAIYNLCKDLQEKYAEDVVTLALIQWIDELKRLNKIVQDLMIERMNASGAVHTDLVMKDVRAEVDAAYTTLSDVLFAQGLIASLGTDATLTAKYSELIIQWNEAITRAENILAARRGRAAAKTLSESGLKD